jgi:hypothetical protein
MEARMTYWHETKTKKYHDLANRIAVKGFTVRFFAFEVPGWKVIAHLPRCIGTSEEDQINDLLPKCTEMLPKDLPHPFIIKFRTIMLIKGHGPDFKLECRQATVV